MSICVVLVVIGCNQRRGFNENNRLPLWTLYNAILIWKRFVPCLYPCCGSSIPWLPSFFAMHSIYIQSTANSAMGQGRQSLAARFDARKLGDNQIIPDISRNLGTSTVSERISWTLFFTTVLAPFLFSPHFFNTDCVVDDPRSRNYLSWLIWFLPTCWQIFILHCHCHKITPGKIGILSPIPWNPKHPRSMYDKLWVRPIMPVVRMW